MVSTLQEKLVGLEVEGARDPEIGLGKPGVDAARHRPGDLILDREDVFCGPIEHLRPALVSRICVDEPGSDAQPPARLADAAFDEQGGGQPAPDLLRIRRITPELATELATELE